MINELLSSIQNLEKINAQPRALLEVFKQQLNEKGIEVKIETEAVHDYSKFAETTLEPFMEQDLLSSRFEFGDEARIYSSCIVFPLVVNNKLLATLSIFSKEKVPNEDFPKIRFLLNYIKKIIENQELKKKAEELINYFQAFFDDATPKLLLNEKGEIIAINKTARDLGDEEFFRNVLNSEKILIKDKIFVKRELKSGNSKIVLLEDVTEEEKLRTSFNLASKLACFISLKNGKIEEASGGLLDTEKIKGASIEALIKEKEIIEKIDKLEENEEFTCFATLLLPNNVEKKIKIFAKKDNYTFLLLVQAESEYYLQQTKKKFEEFIENSPEPIYAIDQNGIIVYMNNEAKNVFGNLIGNHVKNIYRKDEESELFSDIQKVIAGEEVKRVETFRVSKNGEELLFSKSIIPTLDENGNIEKFYYILESKYIKLRQRELEKEIEKKERQIRELRKISELKSSFIYNISHDLKTPLTSIKGFAQLLYKGEFGELNDEQKQYLQTILSETDRFMELLTRILEVARIEAKKIKLQLAETDISQLLQSPAIKSFEEIAKKKGLYFNIIIGENIPKIICDQTRVVEAIVNLVSNAVKFTQKGGVTIKVFKKSRKFIQVEVSDTGIGIKEEDQKKLFKKFYQIERKTYATQEGSGTGLGLSITKEIVRLHGGRIGVISQVGKGSTFWFTLPISGPKEKKGKE
jgi:PAS domain S-box-containing protein